MGVSRLHLERDWMEHLTMREHAALMGVWEEDRYREEASRARVAQALGGGKLTDWMLSGPPRSLTPPERSYDDLAAILGSIPGVGESDG